MESIKIKKFLTIEDAFFEIKKINILIGKQASGKSVIAKLFYFFKERFKQEFYSSIKKLETKRELEKNCLKNFEKIFPRYAWLEQEFFIEYISGPYTISIVRKNINNKFIIKFDYCKNLQKAYRKFLTRYKKALIEFDERLENGEEEELDRDDVYFETVFSYQHESKFEAEFGNNVFIPAARSFFANLQKNVFSFLASNIEIDPLIKEFGSRYESSKRLYQRRDKFFRKKINRKVRDKIDKLIVEIASGDYVYEKEQDWIVSRGKKTNLANASSGQQESMPMLLVLSVWALRMFARSKSTFFIEEPEAHLFPTSQKKIISFIATLHNNMNQKFFITTHSPYILTAINNLVVSFDAYKNNSFRNGQKKELQKLAPENETIEFEDVSAYTLDKGRLVSILDMENRIVGASLLDSVSDEFDEVFDLASTILYGADE